MAIDRSNPEFIKILEEMEYEIGKKSKTFVLRLNSWRKFMYLVSSYTGKAQGDSDAEYILTVQQSNEIAFSYDYINHPDFFVLIFQPVLYECLKNIGIVSSMIMEDGVVINIKETNIYDRYISPFSFKIPISPNLSTRLKTARESAKYLQIACISNQYDSYLDENLWAIDEVHKALYPLFTNPIKAVNYQLENQD